MVEITTIAVIAPVLLWIVSVTIGKQMARLSGNFATSLLIAGFGILPILALFLNSNSPVSTYAIVLSVISGFFLILGELLYYKSLETEQQSNSSAMGLAQPIILIMFGIFALKETISILQAIGGAIIVAGIFLVITNEKFKINKMLLPALLANISWAAYWIFGSYAILSSKQIGAPLLISRTIAFLVAAVAFKLLFLDKKAKAPKPFPIGYILLLGFIAGIFDGLGNYVFGFVVTLNLVYFASILNTASPLFLTVIGYLVYKERLTKPQGLGMVIAMIGALMVILSS